MCIPDYANMATEDLIPLYGASEEAARVLINRHQRAVYVRCYQLTYRPDNAEVAAQETWLRVQQLHLDYENRGTGTGVAWLLMVATYEALTIRNAANRYNCPLEHGAGLEAVAPPEVVETLHGLIELLPELTPRLQAVLMLTDPRCQGSGSNPGQDVALLLANNRKGVTHEMAEALAALRKLYDETL